MTTEVPVYPAPPSLDAASEPPRRQRNGAETIRCEMGSSASSSSVLARTRAAVHLVPPGLSAASETLDRRQKGLARRIRAGMATSSISSSALAPTIVSHPVASHPSAVKNIPHPWFQVMARPQRQNVLRQALGVGPSLQTSLDLHVAHRKSAAGQPGLRNQSGNPLKVTKRSRVSER